MIGQASQIAVGHMKEFFDLEKELYNKRRPICNSCPLLTTKEILGIETEVCNSDLYLNPKTNEVSTEAKNGFYQGCSCRIGAALRVKDKKCPAGKW